MTNPNKKFAELIDHLVVGDLFYLHVHSPQVINNPRPNIRKEVAKQILSFPPFQSDYDSYVRFFEHLVSRFVEDPEAYSAIEWEFGGSRMVKVPVLEVWGVMHYFVHVLPAQIVTGDAIGNEKRIKIVTKNIGGIDWSPWRDLRSEFTHSKEHHEGKACVQKEPFFTKEEVEKLKDKRWTERAILDRVWEEGGIIGERRRMGGSEDIVSVIYSNGHIIPKETIKKLQEAESFYHRSLKLIPPEGKILPDDVQHFLTCRDYAILELRQANKMMSTPIDQFKR